jgi:S-DNA-T family DNA segregation ATPase FtsK/SpoIIIE
VARAWSGGSRLKPARSGAGAVAPLPEGTAISTTGAARASDEAVQTGVWSRWMERLGLRRGSRDTETGYEVSSEFEAALDESADWESYPPKVVEEPAPQEVDVRATQGRRRRTLKTGNTGAFAVGGAAEPAVKTRQAPGAQRADAAERQAPPRQTGRATPDEPASPERSGGTAPGVRPAESGNWPKLGGSAPWHEDDAAGLDIVGDDSAGGDAVVETPARGFARLADAPYDHAEIGPVIVEPEAFKHRPRAADLDLAQQQRLHLAGANPEWEFPPMSYLGFKEAKRGDIDRDRLRDEAATLEAVLGSFNVRGKVINICPGPVVTLYEFEPESGTKLSKISGLTDNIAMALRAMSIRIIAPIPGKGCVGIEVPSPSRETVYLKEIIASDGFLKAKSKLTLALGKDIEGNPISADLAKMPHLLIAGTTGSGKSVAVNGMLTSLLYNASPDDVRMILIDPKQLEFAIYDGIPHLLLPVVTDPMKAATALQWAVAEMERRYSLMAEFRVRNIQGYNEKLAELRAKVPFNGGIPDEITGYEEMLARTEADGRPRHRHMPFIIVIVDEFADLMMVAGKDVEQAVARLAQKARAAGVHVILATQRPSVDVITGLIKANFPTRISFRLVSGTDSRTVLDTIGAENLLGMGDMLFRPPGRSDLVRVHGAFVDEVEIEKVVTFLKEQRAPQYDESILEAREGDEAGAEDSGPVDEMYVRGVQACFDEGFASISLIQRRLGIGYNRAAKIMEQMERDGIVGPSRGGSSRRELVGSPGMARGA